MIRISARDNSFPLLSHRACFAVIADLGLDGVDVSVSDRHGQLSPAAVLDDPEGEAIRIRKLAEAEGLLVADVFVLAGYGPNTLSVNEKDLAARARAREHFERHLAFALALGAPGLSLLPGDRWEDDADAAFKVAAEELQWRAERAARDGLLVSVEPHAASVAGRPAAVAALLDAAPDLWLTLDYSHFEYRSIPQSEVHPLLARTRHLQARQAAAGGLQATASTGTIDFATIARHLVEQGYDRWIGLEYTWNDWIPEVDTIAQSALLRDTFREALARD